MQRRRNETKPRTAKPIEAGRDETSDSRRDRRIVRLLADWFEENARLLPWRTTPRKPYPSLVSESMLQQTQVSRVLEKFGPFVDRFPSVEHLAAADEADVLAAWSGLGYYRRARLLHACAKAIVKQHGGTIPRSRKELEELPGIGRYTAGAVASIVFGEREAIVDGNVCRVLQRLEVKEGHAGDRNVTDWAWKRAEGLVALTSDRREVRAFNEGLMELGATVCVPGKPKCVECPLSKVCAAKAKGLQDTLPESKPGAARKRIYHDVVMVWREGKNGEQEFLLEKRRENGLWAGMWQPPARESTKRKKTGIDQLLAELDLGGAHVNAKTARRTLFQTTHRDVHFRVWVADGKACECGERRWVGAAGLDGIGMSNAHRGLILPRQEPIGGRDRGPTMRYSHAVALRDRHAGVQ